MDRNVRLERTADEVLGVEGTDDRAFLLAALRAAYGLLGDLAREAGVDASALNDCAELDHVEDAIEMLSGERPTTW